MRYKIGQVVRSRNTGNKMTIKSFEYGKYKCFWFIENNLFREFFKEEQIASHEEYDLYIK